MTLLTPAGSVAVRAGIVSPNYFETLGVRLVHGRTFAAHETERGPGGLAVVISHHLWQTALQGRADLGREPLILNGRPVTIVGVAEPEFRGAILAEHADLWVPLESEPRTWLQPGRSSVAVAMIGRLAPGATRAQAHAELATFWSRRVSDPSRGRRPRPITGDSVAQMTPF